MVALVALLALAAVQAAPNDPHFAQQWGLEKINAPDAWAMSRGRGVVVAVVDSGVDLTHPDLQGAFARRGDGSLLGRDFVDDDDEPTDHHGHGTMVAGVVAARTANGIGVAAVAPLTRIMPIRVLDAEAAGNTADVDAAIRWAVDNGAHVVNLSLEIAREDGLEVARDLGQQAPDAAVRYAWERGVIVVAAAGNDSSGFTDYRDDTPVVLVGATDREDRRAPFSDAGRSDMLMAPGTEIVSTWCNPCGSASQPSVGQSDGTSYAAPHVAGSLALLLAAGTAPTDAVRLLRETAVDLGPAGRDPEHGYGRIDTQASLRAAGARAPRPEDEPIPPQGEADPDQTAAGDETDEAVDPDEPPEEPAEVVPPTEEVQDAPPPDDEPSPDTEPSPEGSDRDELAATDEGEQRWPVAAAFLLLGGALGAFALAWRSRLIGPASR